MKYLIISYLALTFASSALGANKSVTQQSEWRHELRVGRQIKITVPRTIPQLLKKIERETGIKIQLGSHGLARMNGVRYGSNGPTVQDREKVVEYLKMLSIELRKYTPKLRKRSKIKNIAIVKYLWVGLHRTKQYRSAMPDYVNEVLYLNFLAGYKNKEYQRHCIHHEFYHLLEEELTGDVRFQDRAWASLNSPDFEGYGAGGGSVHGQDVYPVVHPQIGFINLYSMSGIEEDKATIFAALFIDRQREKMLGWAEEDKYLKAKINFMLQILRKIDSKY